MTISKKMSAAPSHEERTHFCVSADKVIHSGSR